MITTVLRFSDIHPDILNLKVKLSFDDAIATWRAIDTDCYEATIHNCDNPKKFFNLLEKWTS